MSRRSAVLEWEARASLSGTTRMTLNYLAVFVFTLFAVSASLAIIPGGVTAANLRALIFDTPFLHWLGNVALIALTVSITGVALASTAGYALSRFRFLDRSTVLNGLFVTQMFAATMLLVPLYLIVIKLGLINPFLAVIIIYTATALPFCIWQMKGYYDTIPLWLEEAAAIDGCTRWQSFRLVVLPLAVPALVVTGLFSFMTAWNEYVVAAIVFQDMKIFGLPLGLKMFQSNMSAQWSLYAAGALLVSIPVVVLFLALSTFLISGAAKVEESGGLESSPAYH
jgi:arabinogalactan oligomer/maltooligosaccharide transport system permease protein